MSALTIGRVAALSGVPAKTIRHYDETGLLRCHGDDRPTCPILGGLADSPQGDAKP